MQTLRLLTLVFAAKFVSGGDICALYDEQGNKLGSDPHFMGTFPKDIKPGNVLPGRLLVENFRGVTLKSGTCNSDYFEPDLTSNWLTFNVTDKYRPGGLDADGCTFVLRMDKGGGCSDAVATEFKIEYLVAGEVHAPIFTKENYTFQMSFPVSKGTIINEEDIAVMDLNFSTISLQLQDPFDGIEIVRLDSSTDQEYRFQLRTTKLLYLVEDLRTMLVAKTERGEITSTAPFTLRMNEDSAVPKAEFEKSFYDVSVQASQLNPNANIYPSGMIKLKERYNNLSLDIRTLNDDDLYFGVSRAEGSREVDVRLVELPKTNPTSRDVFLQLRARLTNAFGSESEASAFLLIRAIGNPECVGHEHVENKEQLAMIILSIIVAILLFIIIYLYFKYVRGRKTSESSAKVTSVAPVVRHRRPTPRIISEYPYPLEKLPKPLETLAETEEDARDGVSNRTKYVEIQIAKDEAAPKPKISTRKRSVTFMESDLESRQNREAVDVTPQERNISHEKKTSKERKISKERKTSQERKISQESRRSSREQDERKRRTSSAMMYRCLT